MGELLDRLDEARAAVGCDRLSTDAALAAVAQAHSRAMRDEDFFGLTSADGTSLLEQGARAAAIARGKSDPDDVLDEWLDDPKDAAVIRNCALRSVGIGHADGDSDGPWWTLLLA